MPSGPQPGPRFLITSYAAGVRINREIRAKAEADDKAAAAAAAADDGGGPNKTAPAAASRFGFSFKSAASAAPAKGVTADFLL
jgi:hypothetical protein